MFDGRATRATFAIAGFRYGFTFTTAGSLATAGMVGTLVLVIASNFCTGALVMSRAHSHDASTCFEYLFTPSCHPPTVPTDWPPGPCGRTVTLNFPTIFDVLGSAPIE